MYEIKILPNRRLTTPLFCTHALRSSLECEIDTAVEPFREKNNNVKPACHTEHLSGKVLFVYWQAKEVGILIPFCDCILSCFLYAVLS